MSVQHVSTVGSNREFSVLAYLVNNTNYQMWATAVSMTVLPLSFQHLNSPSNVKVQPSPVNPDTQHHVLGNIC